MFLSSASPSDDFNIIKVIFTFIWIRPNLLIMIASESKRDSKSGWQHPLLALNEEELDLVLQLVLASGSLKDLARVYQVSYPTIRLRVDRLIERVRQLANGVKPDPMMQLLAELVERGEISVPAARSVRDLYRQQKENSNDGGTVV